MDLVTIYEIIGYVASALVALSLMMRSILKLRIINLMGATAFFIYGLLIGALPVALVNFIIILINVYYLYGFYRNEEQFTLLEVRSDSTYLRQYLAFHEKEIKRFLPDFSYTPSDNQIVLFVLRNTVPAGAFIAETRNGDALQVRLDFATPEYRDLKIGRFLYQQQRDFFRKRGIRRLLAQASVKAHADYLKRMGFASDSTDSQQYRLSLEKD